MSTLAGFRQFEIAQLFAQDVESKRAKREAARREEARIQRRDRQQEEDAEDAREGRERLMMYRVMGLL